MRISLFVIAIAFSVVNASENAAKNSTAGVTKTKDARGKRNLNNFGSYGANRRNDGYNYQPSGYNHEPSNYIGGGAAPTGHGFYPEAPEPIIEIIIQDNNETLPAPPITLSNGKKKKEQVQVFYVKYHKDEKSGLVIHDPIPALSPVSHHQEEESEEEEPLQIVTPQPQRSTTLQTIIRPDSQQYESDSGVHVTFGSPHNHHSKSDNHIPDEDKVESAIRPVIQLPQNRAGPVGPLKEKRDQPNPNQGRIVNQAGNFHQPPQSLVQNLPHQRPHVDFNQQHNFIPQSNQAHLSHQLSLPSQDPSKPFHPNSQVHHHPQQQHNLRPQQPVPIPVHHQQQNHQFGQPLAHQQFNQPPQRLPSPQLPQPQPQQQQQTVFRPPQRAPVAANFNQNQKPFNYHAHATQPQQNQQVRFPNQPNQPQQQFQGPPQNFPPTFQQQQNLQRPQTQHLPPRLGPSPNFHNQNQQLPPLNRPVQQFNPPQFTNQQFPPNQGPPPNFRPNQEHTSSPQNIHTQPLHQHNQHAIIQNQQHVQNSQNAFRGGGLVEQVAPNLSSANARPHFTSQPNQNHADSVIRQEQNNFIQSNFGTDVQIHSSEPKFEHHITETVNGPIFFQPTAIDMDNFKKGQNIGPLSGDIGHLQVAQPTRSPPESQHRFAVNQYNQQSQQTGSVSNHFSQVFPQIENQQKHFPAPSFLELNGRNNFSPEPRVNPTTRLTSAIPTTTTTPRPEATTVTAKPVPTTTKRPALLDLPDEVPDDLREQLLASGILDNAQISILDYDKVGATSLQDLPAEHLANFFNAGGGAQIGESNRVISVLKPNGDSIDEKIKTLKNDKKVTKLLNSADKLPSKKEDVSLKVVKFDSQLQKNLPDQFIQKDSKILPTVNVDQNNYNRYLPLKINGAHFPIPDVEELRGKKITSVVVLAPVNGNDEDTRYERETLDSKQIKFIAGDSLKNLLRKPSTDNFKKWLEKEQKTNPDLQSVVLLVTNDNITDEQEIFMYDIISKTVNRLSGELSSKFVDVAEENIFEDGPTISDRIDESVDEDSEAEPSEVVESVVKFDSSPVTQRSDEPENKVLISSGYSVIKSE